MKKTLLKVFVFVAVFFVTMAVAHRMMNQGHENITMEMAPADFPVMRMLCGETAYNPLHAYAREMDISYQHDNLTVLSESRTCDFIITPYGQQIAQVLFETRNIDDGRLIEQGEVADLDSTRSRVRGTFAFKDLLQRDVEYLLSVCVVNAAGREFHFYTRILWGEEPHAQEKLDFVSGFHEKLFDREAARELTKYMETNAALTDNSTFARVDIHSSFAQMTYGDLGAVQEGETQIRYRENFGSLASFLVDSLVRAGEDRYFVREYFRIRYTQERIYLLNYERTMEQIPDPDRMCANDKIALGITDENVHMAESEDGNILAFTAAGTLFCYNASSGKLGRVFGFYDDDHFDERTTYDAHGIKILGCSEAGIVQFAVYGYMNRGRHQGEVGIALYQYDSEVNTIEELVYIPYAKTAAILEAEMEKLLYLNREGHLYLSLQSEIYLADIEEKTVSEYGSLVQDDTMLTSADHRIMVTLEDLDGTTAGALRVTNLKDETQIRLLAGEGEAIRFLGFIGDDLIYGLARREDIRRDKTGRMLYPLYRVCICTEGGRLLKDYEKNGLYVTDCRVEDNQITLERIRLSENGEPEEALPDNITTSEEVASGKNVISVAVIETYERFVQIRTRSQIDTKSLKVVTPKEVVYEGGRELRVDPGRAYDGYYVYDAYGVAGIYNSPAGAVTRAYEVAGLVLEEDGNPVWRRSSRVFRNQIMAIGAESVTQDKNSLAICLDTILKYEGVIRNSDYLLGQGQSVLEILEGNLPQARVMDLTGCTLDNVLYYVNMDIPVLVLLQDGGALLVTGFNENQIVVLDPESGELEKRSISSQTAYFEEQGNVFITYAYHGQER
ncbi:MAG: hypothetical protein K6E92_03520 [Lachnospiraceae bacterium]|nr:hypothetical protein [Lachnospiraceae bacterium]